MPSYHSSGIVSILFITQNILCNALNSLLLVYLINSSGMLSVTVASPFFTFAKATFRDGSSKDTVWRTFGDRGIDARFSSYSDTLLHQVWSEDDACFFHIFVVCYNRHSRHLTEVIYIFFDTALFAVEMISAPKLT